jgi:predicted DsbA family dithiol-disulfide isomerase
MRIEFWLDYLSPSCYKQHLALELLFKKYRFSDLELLYRSYEMIPHIDLNDTKTLEDVLSKHHVITLEEAKALTDSGFEDMRAVHVLDAHRLSHLAKKSDLAFEFNQALFHHFYVKKEDISDHKILTKIALKVGLPADKVKHVLESDLFKDAVQMNRENAIVKGIFDVPHLRIDGKIRLQGYHGDDQIIEALTMASVRFSKTDYCEGDNCDRKKVR